MKCDSPIKVLSAGMRAKSGKVYHEDVLVRCGRCYACRITRLRSWAFRLRQEEKISKSGYFVTLTYDPKHVPITKNGFMTLQKSDVQKFFKKLRNCYRYKKDKKWMYDKVKDIRYYAVGEYGTKKSRPHYHLIIFNADDDYIVKSWEHGDVKLGTVTNASVAYTLTYMITKSAIEKKHSRDDRLKEFSLMSKGLGMKYLTDSVVKYYQMNEQNMFIYQDDKTKIGLPRIYRNYIFDDDAKERQVRLAQEVIKKIEIKESKLTDVQKRAKHNVHSLRINKKQK